MAFVWWNIVWVLCVIHVHDQMNISLCKHLKYIYLQYMYDICMVKYGMGVSYDTRTWAKEYREIGMGLHRETRCAHAW